MNSFDGSAVNKTVWEQFDKQRNRGVQGFGFFNGKFTIKSATEKRIRSKLLSGKKNQSDLLLFHHRFPTSTENVKRAAHPFNTGSYFGNVRYVLVHNGVIRNAKDIRDKHIKLDKPVTYQSVLENGKFNDSEALLWDMALVLEGKKKELEVYGDIAFICIKMVDNVPEKMFFGRNNLRPLKMKRDDITMMLSSEGEGEDVKPGTLYTYNYKKKRLTDKFFRLPTYNTNYASGWNYDKKYGTGTKGTTSHASHTSDNVCAPGSGVIAHGYPTEVSWWEVAEEDDIIFDASGNPHYPYEVTFYDDGTYDLWNDVRRNYETGYWSEDDFFKKEKQSEKKFMDFIKAPKVKKASNSEIVTAGGIIMNLIKPKQEDVAMRIFHELGKVKGIYDEAYYAMESDYVDLQEFFDGGITPPIKERKEMALIEEAMKQIMMIPEYQNEASVHPLWAIPASAKVGEQTNFLALIEGGK